MIKKRFLKLFFLAWVYFLCFDFCAICMNKSFNKHEKKLVNSQKNKIFDNTKKDKLKKDKSKKGEKKKSNHTFRNIENDFVDDNNCNYKVGEIDNIKKVKKFVGKIVFFESASKDFLNKNSLSENSCYKILNKNYLKRLKKIGLEGNFDSYGYVLKDCEQTEKSVKENRYKFLRLIKNGEDSVDCFITKDSLNGSFTSFRPLSLLEAVILYWAVIHGRAGFEFTNDLEKAKSFFMDSEYTDEDKGYFKQIEEIYLNKKNLKNKSLNSKNFDNKNLDNTGLNNKDLDEKFLEDKVEEKKVGKEVVSKEIIIDKI